MKYPDLLFVLLLLCLSMFEIVLKLLYMITDKTLMRKCFNDLEMHGECAFCFRDKM